MLRGKERFRFFERGQKLLHYYHDKNGIRIRITEEIDKHGYTIYVFLYLGKHENKFSLIDGCFDECIYTIEKELFFSLRRNKKWRVARRWLWKMIKDMKFEDYDLFVKDFFRDGLVDYNKVGIEYDRVHRRSSEK